MGQKDPEKLYWERNEKPLSPPEIMLYRLLAIAALGFAAASAEEVAAPNDMVEDNDTAQRRELFPVYALGTKCARRGCSIYNQIQSVNPVMALNDASKGPIKALEMLAMNDDLNTVVQSDNMCTRRQAMARAAGLAAGLALARVNAPGFAAETKSVKMGSDSGQLVFVPDEITICKGDTVTWTNNKGGPHNVVFDEDAIPSGVSQESISMDDQLGEEGETFSKKFDVAGNYAYYCEPHRGAGMNANLIVK
jgi:plastocyanin